MGRHSKNNNDRAFFTYHERKAATKGYASSAFYKHSNTGYGGGELRVGCDSLRDFDACCLSLHPCRHPVITPEGFLYEREVIYEYILQKRKDNERALAAFAAQESTEAADAELASQQAQARTIEAFERAQRGSVGPSSALAAPTTLAISGAKSAVRGHVINDDTSKHAKDMNFWTPQNAPSAKERVDKPDTTIRCPMSGEPLRLKQLVAVHFTPAHEEDEQGSGGRAGGSVSGKRLEGTAVNERYICPLTKKNLSNSAQCVVLRHSGRVVTKDCLEKIIRIDMVDPFCEPPKKLKDKDIIPIRTEGTGYAARGNTQIKKKGAAPAY